jgi:hypothetical protein
VGVQVDAAGKLLRHSVESHQVSPFAGKSIEAAATTLAAEWPSRPMSPVFTAVMAGPLSLMQVSA